MAMVAALAPSLAPALVLLPAAAAAPPLPAPAWLDPGRWAERTFGPAQLGDRRRTRRLVATAAAVAAAPDASLPRQLRAPAAVKAAYRLLHEPDVTHDALLAPHAAQARAAAAAHPLVLLVQDATDLDFTAHRATADLGPLGDGRGRGLRLQSVLAVLPADGRVLGLAAAEPFRRRPAPRKGERCAERQARPRGSEVWARQVARIGPPPAGRRWVHVGDRGGDVFGFPAACRAQGADVLLRVVQDRCVTAADGAADHLLARARALPAAAERELALPRRPAAGKRPARPARAARLAVAWAAVTVRPPHHSRDQEPLPAWVVRAWEPAPPPAAPEPVEWVLLTTVPTATADEAWERVDWYGRRWLIEEYHQCLKSGCRLEQTQLRDGDAITRLLGILAPVAVRLLQLRAAAREHPEQPAAAVVGERVVRVVAAATGHAPDLTAAQCWRLVARLGGRQGRARDGPPGWRALWWGWQYVQTLLAGVELAAHLPPPRCG
jgi:Transposase DNA-binding/Transposase DDE domain